MPSMITQKPWRLVTQVSDKPVYEDSQHKDFRGQPPLHSASSGRVHTSDGNEFFPQVFDLKWIKS